jgi:hypothetical protein|tara:strand:- start:137 stop:793 length:657 start_codon:yes stop_codon:yes gene_type:complete
MISEKEKIIYNSFLYTQRTSQNKPFRPRQNFDKVSGTEEASLKKLFLLLSKYNHINYNDYFIAPYKIYGKDNYFDLAFYNTTRALKCYTMYMKDKELSDPDNAETIKTAKECIKFIHKYCTQNNLTLSQYKNTIEGTIPVPLQHLREHKINFYTLHSLNIETKLKQLDNQLLDFIVKDYYQICNTTRTKLAASRILKEKIKNGLKIIEDDLINRIESL